ncbi:glycoside hydrolase family 92 protein [Clostridiales bacterium COT073_COT-073]|nr:glycoside hydrolase family 92 protein [Clostridiales bacterium COT073_COT-073]
MAYINYVNIKQGSASLPRFSNGNTLPLVQMPFGMNAYTLQTESSRGNWFYHPKDRAIEGIRLTHQPSPWIGDYMPLVMMPQREESFLTPEMRWSGFRPEEAELMPHYLKVDFLRYRTSLELAPTTRGAVIRLDYQGEEAASFAVLVDKGLAEFQVDFEKNQITGYTQYTSWPSHQDFKMYFIYQFDCLLKKAYLLRAGEKSEEGSRICEEKCGIWVLLEHPDKNKEGLTERNLPDINSQIKDSYNEYSSHIKKDYITEGSQIVNLRLATSFISLEQAEVNLQRELAGKNFMAVKASAEKTWESYLSRIEISGASEEQMRLFYSCMYRVFLFPTKFYERAADGKAIHFCADTGRIKPGLKYVNNGFWDTFRTVYPLYSLIARQEYAEILEGFINTYEDCGWLPKWPSPNEVGMMPGTLIDAVIAEAAVKAIGSKALLERAYQGVKKHLTAVSKEKKYGRQGIADYEALGYLPYTKYHESVNNTLDYVYGDFCISQIASVLGKAEDARKYLARSRNYRQLFDVETGFMRAKDEGGNFRPDFDAFAWGQDYCEGSAWQNSFAVYHDIEGLAALYGGKEQFLDKIDELFATKPYYKRGGYPFEIHEMTEMAAADFGQCAISNQPSFHLPYLYAALGEKEKTEYWIDRLLKEGFSAADDGFPGDEDNGSMAAWVIFAMIGIYPFCVGKDEFIKIKPQVKKVVIHSQEGDWVLDMSKAQKIMKEVEEIVKHDLERYIRVD